MSSVREYWESLCEIPGGYEKAYELWSQIKPLYERLHSFIKDRLNVYHGFDVTYNITPSYLLGIHLNNFFLLFFQFYLIWFFL